MSDEQDSNQRDAEIPLYANYDLDRIAWGLKIISKTFKVGAPNLTESINRFAEDSKLRKGGGTLNVKNIQRALQGKRQQNSTLIILDRYIAAKRPLNRCGRLGEALAEFWAPERMKTDEGMLKGPASFFQRDFVGAYTCFHKRWLSPEDSAAADKDPDHFKNEDGELRVGGVPEPVKGYRPVEFPVCGIHFRPSAGYGSIEMTETASPYLDYKNSPGYSAEPPVLEGALSATDAKDRYFGAVAAERGHHKIYQIKRGAEDKETGVPEWNGTVVSEGRITAIHLVPHPDQQSIGDYFPDELLSEAKKEWLHFSMDDDG